MAQCYTICPKWSSLAIGQGERRSNELQATNVCVCVCVGNRWWSLIKQGGCPRRRHNKSYALTLELVKEPKSLHQHSCVWNANPTKSQASMACYALSCSLLCSMYYAKLSYMSASKWGSKLSSTRTLLLLHLPFSPLALFTCHGVWGLGMEGWVKLCICVCDVCLKWCLEMSNSLHQAWVSRPQLYCKLSSFNGEL